MLFKDNLTRKFQNILITAVLTKLKKQAKKKKSQADATLSFISMPFFDSNVLVHSCLIFMWD